MPTCGLWNERRTRALVLALLCLCAGAATAADQPKAQPKENPLTRHATGPFEVKLTPQADYPGADAPLARMTIDKHFHGDLEAASQGQMLSAGAPDKGSAGYVAIERVTGTLHGRAGSFALLHRGTLDHGQQELSITVVPGSGTGELAGLTGQMKIVIAEGKHGYDFEYALPAK